MKKLAIIADDLSGSNDAGSQVLFQGYTCCSLNSVNSEPEICSEVPVYNSSSRLLDGKNAYTRVNKIALLLSKFDLIYKKTDSTLRGNIGYEIDACIDALNAKRAAFVPAFPVLRRRCIYGRLFLDTKLLENTEFACDALTPVLTSNVIELLKKQSKYFPVLIDLDVIRKGSKAVLRLMAEYTRNTKTVIFIFDGSTNEDLEIIANCLKGFKVVAGASAFIKYLLPKKKLNIVQSRIKVNGKQAFFIGSIKKTTHDQLAVLRKHLKNEYNGVIKEHCQVYSVKYIHKGMIYRKAEGKRIDKVFAEAANVLIEKGGYKILVLSGGATAENIFKALNINYTETIRSILTGIPLTYSPERNLYIVTKPGGYGDKNALVSIYKALKEF